MRFKLKCAVQNNGKIEVHGANVTAEEITIDNGTATFSGMLEIGTLDVNTGTIYLSDVTTANQAYVGTSGMITAFSGTDFSLSITGNMTIQGIVKPANSRLLLLSVLGDLIVQSNGQITADGLGYGRGSGPGVGGYDSASGGGGYGGSGGRGRYRYDNTYTSDTVRYADGGGSYGSITEPADFGSGGGSGAAGSGGGIIRLEVGGTLQLDGNITANGAADGSSSGYGGGSGGSIWLAVGVLAGDGFITTNGGEGSYYVSGKTTRHGGGGSGGRTAIYYESDLFNGTITAYGGSGYNYGGAGTIYLQEDFVDRLIGTVRDAISGGPISGALVIVFGKSALTNTQGEFSFLGLGSGDMTVNVTTIGYYDVSQVVNLQGNANQRLDIRMTPEVSGTNQAIAEIRGKYCGPGDHAYYLDDVSLSETFTITIDWKGYTPGIVRWITPSGTYEDSCPGTTISRSFDMGTDFGIGGKLEVIAIAADLTQSLPKQANFNVISAPPGVPTAVLKEDTTSTVLAYNAEWILDAVNNGVAEDVIDEDIPGFGGRAFEFVVKPLIEAKVSGDGFATGAIVGGYELPYMDIAGVGVASSASVSLGWQYSSEQQQWLPTGQIQINVAGDYSTPPSYYIIMVGPVPVPVYWRVALEAALGVQLSLNGWQPDGSPTWNGTIPFNVYAEIMLGVGVADVLAAEGYLGGGAYMRLEFPNEDPLQQLDIELDGGIRLVALIFKYENNLLHYEWHLVGGESMQMLMPMTLGTLDASNFELMRRDYLDSDYAVWVPEVPQEKQDNFMVILEAQTMAGGVEPNEEQLLQSNVFSQSQPTIAADGNDVLLAWIYDDPGRTSMNRTVVVFSKCENNVWSQPVAIDDDGTADFSPQLASLPDGDALCIWENAKQELPNDVNLTDMAAAMEIEVGFYDNDLATWTTQAITDNNHLDRSPRIATADNNTAIVVWIYNGKDDILGSDSNALNEIHYSQYNGIDWNESNTVATDLGLIIKTAFAYDGNEAVYVYTLDSDHNWQTEDDRELYTVVYDGNTWSEPNQITDNNSLDANPQVVYDDSDIFLVWYRDANLVSTYNFDMNNVSEVMLTAGSSGSMDFRLAKSPVGQISLVWTETSDEGVDIFTATYDSELSIWSKAYQLTSDANMERSVAATYAGSDELALAYNKVEIIDNNGIPEPNKVDLYVLRHTIKGDLAITTNDITFNVKNPLPGSTVDVNAVIHNIGDVAEVNVSVAFYNGDPDSNGILIDDVITIAGLMAAGDTAVATASWFVPAVNEPQQIYVVVDPNFEIEDVNRNNNIASVSVMTPDLTISDISSERIGPKMRGITARIKNIGGLPAENVAVSIRKEGEDGEQLANFNIEYLDPDSSYDTWYVWDIATQDFNTVEILLYVIADANDSVGELNEDNNTSFGLVQVGKVADFTDNGRIDIEDLSILTGYWLEDAMLADISPTDGDGIVNFLDFAKLMEYWLWQAGWYSN